ncbi:MAG: aldehyde dehydrogenase family protein [Phycisphaerales bacterium]|nr:aldehyde dehydrogenase family protein [Phycisphaerales bacterium]
MTASRLLSTLGLDTHPLVSKARPSEGQWIATENPTTAESIAWVRLSDRVNYDAAVVSAADRFRKWRLVPAPRRGEIVRQIGLAIRERVEPLGELISLEMGKIRAEGIGEIQECIDICDFAVGLSRQLYGMTTHSERPQHRMYEQWHPLGPIGIITAFNFPAAVWAWNAMVAAVCGDTMIWKPSLLTPLTAIALHETVEAVMRAHDLEGVFELIIGTDEQVGEAMIRDKRLPLISATGSCRMGRHIGQVVASRLGRTLLELGGNNALIICDDADLDLAARAVVFGAVGTTGQRCTTTRRLFVQRGAAEEVTGRLISAYETILPRIGDPLDPHTLMGPMIHVGAVEAMIKAVDQARAQGGEVLFGGNRLQRTGYFVEPTIIRAAASMPIVHEETFAPILYLIEFDDLETAIAEQNAVDQGLSSAIFTDSVRRAERFLSHAGSDCGIANVNIGTSGAEIGGAFGGEKDTGGGRESGSDAWKAYMRRQTCTINWGSELPLAQGIRFEQ